MRTRIKVTPVLAPARERQIVATRLARDPEISAGASPFGSVGRDATAPGTKLREQMRQFVTQSAVYLRRAVDAEPAVQQHARDSIFRAPGGRPQTGRPFDQDTRGQRGRAVLAEKVARKGGEHRIATG